MVCFNFNLLIKLGEKAIYIVGKGNFIKAIKSRNGSIDTEYITGEEDSN